MIPIKQAKILSRQAEELTASLFLPILDHPCHNGDRIKKQLDNHPLRGTLSA